MNFKRQKNCWQQDIKKKEYIKGGLQGLVMGVAIALLFYRSWGACLLVIPFGPIYFRAWEQRCVKRKMQEFQLQFKEALQNLSASLNVGYSVENAIKGTLRDLRMLYGKDTRIIKEFSHMVHQLNMNVTAEQTFKELSRRVQQEDVQNFVTVFVTANRSGGDLLAVLKRAGTQICGKIEVKREIQVIMAAKRLEFQVMTAVPFAILVYMQLSFSGFMDKLYGNWLGGTVMSFCLAGYLFAYRMGSQMIDIEV